MIWGCTVVVTSMLCGAGTVCTNGAADLVIRVGGRPTGLFISATLQSFWLLLLGSSSLVCHCGEFSFNVFPRQLFVTETKT